MSDPISIALAGLIHSHKKAVRTFSDLNETEIVTEPGVRYELYNVRNTKINMNAGCKKLTLVQCHNINITSERLPVMGVDIVQSDNIGIRIFNTPPRSGHGYISFDHSVLGALDTDQECMVEVNECINITFNNVNISNQYHDSTWITNGILDA